MPLNGEEVVRLWERGEGRCAAERALMFVAHARPDADRQTLAAMPVGERDTAIIGLRVATFGRMLEATNPCPGCGTVVDYTLDAEALVASAPVSAEARALEAAGWRLRFRLPTAGDMVAIGSEPSLEAARARLLERCLIEVRGPEGGEAMAAEIPAEVLAPLEEAMAKLDPASDSSILLSCPSCQRRWEVLFDIPAFLWNEITALARRLLGEVDELASRYGWSERDILALSPRRRTAYLERDWA